MNNCLGCTHFVPQPHPVGVHRGTCTVLPVWQTINNGDTHHCGQHSSQRTHDCKIAALRGFKRPAGWPEKDANGSQYQRSSA